MRSLLLIVFLFGMLYSNAQILSQFSWDSNPVTTADIGPDAISVSSSAVSSIGGVGGTNGLNAGLPKADLDFVIPAGAAFDVDGINVSFDFQRDESAGRFFRRGSSLVITGANNLRVSYRVEDGSGGFFEINSGNVYSIANDNIFRTYVFNYDPNTGIGMLSVNGVTVWMDDGPDNTPMYWVGAGNIVIGDGLDGSGSNRAFLDNLIIGENILSPLPVELLDFTALKVSDKQQVAIHWVTATELDNDYFTIERSQNGLEWEVIESIEGMGTSSIINVYDVIDSSPLTGTSYYRLKQTDFDGTFTYSDLKSVYFDNEVLTELTLYPNPVNNVVTIEGVEDVSDLRLYSLSGEDVSHKISIQDQGIGQISVELNNIASGVYIIRAGAQAIRLIKQ